MGWGTFLADTTQDGGQKEPGQLWLSPTESWLPAFGNDWLPSLEPVWERAPQHREERMQLPWGQHDLWATLLLTERPWGPLSSFISTNFISGRLPELKEVTNQAI